MGGSFSSDGKVGGSRVGQVDTVKNFQLGETTILNGNKVAVYVLVSETVSGSTIMQLSAGFTAAIALSAPTTTGGFVAMLGDGVDAIAGQYIWVRASAPITSMTA